MMGNQRYRNTIDAVLDHYDVAATSAFVEGPTPGGRVHYLEAGTEDGEPVVLLHGGGSQVTEWIPLLAELSGFRVLALERPGYGLSDPFDHRGSDYRAFNERLLSGFMREVGAETAHVVGNSFGGFHALAFARQCPESVDSVVVIGAPAGITRRFPWMLRLLGVRGVNRLVYPFTVPGDVQRARDVYQRINVVDDGALPDVFFESVVAAGEVRGREETVLSLFENVVGIRGASDELYIREEIQSIAAPTMFVWGESDWYYPPSVGRPVAEGMPEAEFVELESANHKPWLEPDSTVGGVISEFLSESGE